MSRGHFGVGIWQPKSRDNMGTLLRSAQAFGADYAFTIGRRYKHQRSDTTKAPRHVPVWHFDDFPSFQRSLPLGSRLVGVEYPADSTLGEFAHPPAACYLLGAEDNGLPDEVLDSCQHVVAIEGAGWCLNVAVAGSIVIRDRVAKAAS